MEEPSYQLLVLDSQKNQWVVALEMTDQTEFGEIMDVIHSYDKHRLNFRIFCQNTGRTFQHSLFLADSHTAHANSDNDQNEKKSKKTQKHQTPPSELPKSPTPNPELEQVSQQTEPQTTQNQQTLITQTPKELEKALSRANYRIKSLIKSHEKNELETARLAQELREFKIRERAYQLQLLTDFFVKSIHSLNYLKKSR